ncbi:CDP-diacylglycerol--glycerol-3-phosphate 3-phosphatidyltransferase [Natronospira bacteriovora]|uniref:CDP-diacylglycerol--glycerol-3-phosphate 3-phosphatidyltransferase n=1 Tax=Natronospira bacteriovora TaxID=3069753 RepID=A0ABU0W9N6_9GAMM|nr:CDP-diacylglycerol--glycerol-3-phosphate 3-phosphatidyltransferase [Natronospira sp. AB-CW4]MDQ2070752.1 CDP-diacylglycerol--glycerol-3-phosphate 3-phosphatidyltransferase [Natronospira sp. AB-CW4]
MPLNIPNSLTLFRIAMIPVFMLFFFLPFKWAAPASAIIFALAAITDWLDGYLARKLGQFSNFGAFLDPVADKLMVVAALVLLVYYDGSALMAIPAVVIIGREIAISALREWMSELGSRSSIAVSWMGKVKTTAQMIAIFLLLWRYDIGWIPVYSLGLLLLYVSTVLTLWSMFSYLKAAWPTMREEMVDDDSQSGV